ncbi:flagellar biosynthetic protein FliO [Caulobacter sp. RHG1]|uniref:flagellar biosynthetic protein FliO n=1 Tax=Caulobacter sp. (strain RHG1) TaxID=2545762 RepID=UPI001552F608|nr:flagellar biosynthetic protein FliO [Caulobacter sp. RHG1]NQE60917.1 fliO protein [Caulobacter sp. RHG1]
MDPLEFIRALAALAITLGLIGLAAWALRKFGPDAVGRMIAARQDRRMRVVESLVLDPTRRLLIVSLDGEERMVLLGDGKLLDWIPQPPKTPVQTVSDPEPVA